MLGVHNKTWGAEQVSPFAIRAIHVPFRPQLKTPAFYRGLIDQASQLGYNTFILHTGGIFQAAYTIPLPGQVRFEKWAPSQVTELIAYARQAGLELILEVKVIGKHKALLTELAKKHPGLLVTGKEAWANGILNPAYRFPDGQDAYDAIELPMIDYFIALHGETPPRYMLLGIDEIAVDDLDICAKALNTTVPKLFAQLLNRCTKRLLAKGITPIFWGDMLLGKELSKPGHGVIGFDHDPRIQGGHASWLSQQATPPSTLTAINDLKHRNKIIIADWHYGAPPSGEYPSVDYFQTMGFKDVWGTTWYNDKGIAMFARYAAKRNCGGMIATAWHTTISRSVHHLFQPILNNSAAYFRNPALDVPQVVLTSYRLATTKENQTLAPATERQTGIILGPTPTLSYQVQLTDDPQPSLSPSRGAVLLLSHDQSRKSYPQVMELTFNQDTHQLTGTYALPQGKGTFPHTYSTTLRWTDRDSGYLHQLYRPSNFCVTDRPLAIAGNNADTSTWFTADFSNLSSDTLSNGLIYTAGQFPLLLKIGRPVIKNASVNGALNCRATSASGSNPQNLWSKILSEGMQLDITFKVTNSFKKRAHCALMSFGNYSEGFRLLMAQDQTLLLQFANQNGNAPIWIPTTAKVSLDQWTSVHITLTPDKAGELRIATLSIDDNKPIVVTLPKPISTKNEAPIALGVEFKGHGSRAKVWPNFPGLIRQVTIKPYTSSH